MKRITFDRIKNPAITAYRIYGISSEGIKTKIGEVENPTKTNPVLISFQLTSADLQERLENTQAHTLSVYKLRHSTIIKDLVSATIVKYGDTYLDNTQVIINTVNQTLSIKTPIPKKAVLDVSLYVDSIEYICPTDIYKSFVIVPVTNAQITSIGHHSKLI